MRLPGRIAVLCLALVATGAAPAAAHRPDPEFAARASHARVGGTMRVVAGVWHARRGTAFSATAVVHFGCGDATVQLVPRGFGYRAVALVPVGIGEIPGDVAVDVTITYGDETATVQAVGTVRTLRRNPPPADCGSRSRRTERRFWLSGAGPRGRAERPPGRAGPSGRRAEGPLSGHERRTAPSTSSIRAAGRTIWFGRTHPVHGAARIDAHALIHVGRGR